LVQLAEAIDMTSKVIPLFPVRPEAMVAFCLAGLAVPTSVASAQQDSVTRGCIPHGEIARILEVPSRPVYGTLEAEGDTTRTARMYLATLLQEVARVFVPPDSIPPLLTYTFTLRLHKDGRLTDTQPFESEIPAKLAEATIRAVDSASRLGGIGPTFFEMKADPLPLRMVFRLDEPRSELNVPFYQLRFPAFLEYETDKPALTLRGSPAPRYPEELRQANIEGEVLVQFVVDTLGRADMRTFRLLGPRQVYREFLQAVIDVLPRMRFSPPLYRGCKVKQMVQLPFAFKLNR
jgi:TonB family protein